MPCCYEVRLLRARPARDLAILDFNQSAGRTHAGVRLERPFVLGLDHLRGVLEGLIDIAVLFFDVALAYAGLADVVVQRGLIGERRLDLRPFHLELLGGLDRIPFLVGDDAEEALVPDHFGARNVLDRGFIDFYRHGAGNGRTDHPSMHHAGHLHVGAEIFLGEDLWRDVFALDRLADDLVLARIFRLRFAGRVERVALLLVPVELDIEIFAADQLGVGNAFRLVVACAHNAISDDKLVGRHGQLAGRHLDQHAACFRRRHAHLLAAHLDAGRTGGTALVHRIGGVAHVDLDALERNVELLGDDLPNRHEEAVAHVHLAEEGRDGAVGIDGDVRRQLVRRQRRLGALRGGLLHRQ